MNRQIGIVIVMVSATLFFIVSIVRHFIDSNEAAKEQERIRRDGLVNAQIKHLIEANAVLKDAVQSHEFKINQLKSSIDHVNSKVNLVVNQ